MTITSLNLQEEDHQSRKWYKRRKVILIIIVIIVLILLCMGLIYGLRKPPHNDKEILVPPNPIKPLPPSPSLLRRFKKAAVCADGAQCAEIGKEILKKNGTAVDATLATMFCNGIFTMQSMGLGGGFLMTIYQRQTKTAFTLNAREMAPSKATNDLYKDNYLLSQNGPLSIAVPGELRGYWEAHQRFGRLPWKEIIQPSIQICENGYKMSKHQYESLKKAKFHNDSNFREWFYDDQGKFKPMGSIIKPTKLCETLKIIAVKGADDFYNGTIAEKLIEDIQEVGGLITSEDLRNYTPQWMDPITVKFQNNDRLYSVAPPGSGLILSFIMNILEGFNFTKENMDGIENTIITYHRIIEAFKYAYARRTELGDTSFVNISELIKNLTNPIYANEIRQKIQDNSTNLDPKDYGTVYYTNDDHGTAHISVLSENGDAVSVTSSINIYFGAGLTSKQTGIIWNSVMDDFSFPFFKNYFGLPGSPNNALSPGKRPLSSMSPSIMVDGQGDVKLVLGASGGTKITSGLAWFLARILWFGDNVKEAVDAPRIHHQLFPMEINYEYGTLQQIVDGLEKIGHKTRRQTSASSIICALQKIKDEVFGNADYRKGGEVYGLD